MIDIYTTLDDFKVIEIGVGYGGQCKILCDYFNIKSYDLVDLPEVLRLTEKYLSKYEYNNVNVWDNKPEYDLVISNYAITECDREIQQYYIDNIAKKAKHGYITCNYISDRFDITSMHQKEFISSIGLEKYHLIDENPLTFPGNKVLIW
jgi:putative sugar O-methyltransferase